jgi:hypothetical protein
MHAIPILDDNTTAEVRTNSRATIYVLGAIGALAVSLVLSRMGHRRTSRTVAALAPAMLMSGFTEKFLKDR